MVVRRRPAVNSACTGAMCGAPSAPVVAIAFMRAPFQKVTNSSADMRRSARSKVSSTAEPADARLRSMIACSAARSSVGHVDGSFSSGGGMQLGRRARAHAQEVEIRVAKRPIGQSCRRANRTEQAHAIAVVRTSVIVVPYHMHAGGL